jgi:hypothetical protein
MLKTEKGSPDGIRVNEYYMGEPYDMPESLATVFISTGSAKPMERTRKDAGSAPSNKMIDGAPDDKEHDEESTLAEPQVIPAPEIENDLDNLPLKEGPKKEKEKKAKPRRRSY